MGKARIRQALLKWYDLNARDLPWRTRPGEVDRPDPYRVWLSEIMLQQTTVAAVRPYFAAFLERWPTVSALAAADREAVLTAWAGLGYYARARNLHACAQAVAAQGGDFPDTEEGLRALPGVGAYTAAAVAAIAFGRAANAVDGNVERVMARLHAVREPMPGAKARLRALAGDLVAADRPGDWAQALMDLGATVCTPRTPRCEACPLGFACKARAAGDPQAYPVKALKAPKPERHGVAFWLEAGGEVLLVQRPDEGLLGGMWALPSTPWRTHTWSQAEALAHAPAKAHWRPAGAVRHVFTHFSLTLAVWRGSGRRGAHGHWIRACDAGTAGLPTVFRKAADLAHADP